MTTAQPSPVTLAEATRFRFQLGWVSFGGPAGQIALLLRELVDRRRWLSEGRYLLALHYCMLLPGPEAMQLTTYLGWLMHGVPGGLIAGGLFVIPSVFVLTALASLYALWGELPLLVSVFAVLKPSLLAIVLMAPTQNKDIALPPYFCLSSLLPWPPTPSSPRVPLNPMSRSIQTVGTRIPAVHWDCGC
jgi:chromate transport protein ChrA